VQVYDNAEIAGVFARFAKIHSSLAEYRHKLMDEAAATGMPLTRAMFLHYPNDPATFNLRTQFMLGEEFIVCPVLAADTTHVNCYFPLQSGEWKHLWTGVVASAGSNVLCEATPGEPCVYYRSTSEAATEFLARLEEAGVLSSNDAVVGARDEDQGECDPALDSECAVVE
jgi:alpha-glucosidase